MKKLTRREFLGVAGATVGTMALGKTVISAITKESDQKPAENKEWMSSTCHMCSGECGIEVRVIDGKVIKINPSSFNPSSFSNNSNDFLSNHKVEGGVLCPKGNAGIAALYEPDRVKKPMKRTNPEKGIGVDPKWKEISWDEAYTEIAGKLNQLKSNKEAHKLLWFSDDRLMTDLQEDFCNLFGTPNFSTSASLNVSGKNAAYKMLTGTAPLQADFINSKYILLFGWNPLGSINHGYLTRVIPRAQENGAKLVVVDPYLTATVANSQEWVPIKPGTDGALALAIANVIISKGLQDNEFISKYAVGFDKYKDYVNDKTPEWAENITSIPAKKIVEIALELAKTKPAIIDFGSGIVQNSNGFYSAWAISLLAVLLGQIDKPGTLMFPETTVAAAHVTVEPDADAAVSLKQPRLDGGSLKYPFMDSGVYVETVNMLLDSKAAYLPKVGVVVAQNLVMSLPGTKNIAQALTKLEFLVVIDTLVTETAELADILLPGTTYLEKYALTNNSVSWPAVSLTQPVVKPFFDQPVEYEIIAQLGTKLKLKDNSGKDFFSVGGVSGQLLTDKSKWYLEYLSAQLKNGAAKISVDDLKKLPGGVWQAENGTEFDKLAKGAIKTSSGKIQFSAEANSAIKDSKGKSLKNLPVFLPRHTIPETKYPFSLVNWNEASHNDSYTQNNIYLMNLKSENPLQINTKTAEKLGLKNSDIVLITSAYGRVRAKINITEAIHPDVVGLQNGFGHWASGEIAKNKGTLDAFLRPTVACHVSGQAINKECCVNITKV